MSQLVNTVDGSEIRRLPVEVGRLSHYLRRVLAPSQVLAGFQPSTVGVLKSKSMSSSSQLWDGMGYAESPFWTRSSTWRTMMMKMMKVKI